MKQELSRLRGFGWMGLLVFLGAVVLTGCEYLQPSDPTTKPARTRYDKSYVAALSVADSFCQAWLERNEAIGRGLLSRQMLRKYSNQQLRDAIVGYANPTHAAYELFNGERLTAGRYAFSVRLFFRYAGGHTDRLESPLEQIVIAYDAGRWWVDEFPMPPTGRGVR